MTPAAGPLRIGIVDYLNSWPLAWGFLSGRTAGEADVAYCPPAEVADRLATGALDVGLVPSIELQRIPDLVVVPRLCVAATHEVRSVLLVASGPIESIRSLALDENSRTSAALVRIVLAERYGVEPRTTVTRPSVDEMLAAADAALIIGDPALRVERQRYTTLDLAAEWRALTGLPFVFAVWAARADVAGPEAVDLLERSWRAGRGEMEEIVDRAVRELGLSHAVAERYLLRHLRFVMGPEELAGLREFWRRAHALGLLERLTEARFVAEASA